VRMAGFFSMGLKCGLEVGSAGLRYAEVRQKGGVGTLIALDTARFAPGVLVESFSEPNIKDVPAFVKTVKTMVTKGGRRRKKVNVALPDAVARVVVVEFDNLQQKQEETESMLKWRFKKLVPFSIDKAVLRYQYLGAFRDDGAQKHRFVAAVMNKDVLRQYETALNEAGLRPDRLDVSSFAVWNLFHDYLAKDSGTVQNFSLLNMSGNRMTVMVFERGAMRFMRMKDLGGGIAEGPAGDAGLREGVLRELHASLTYYRENLSGNQVGLLYMCGDMDDLKGAASEFSRKTELEARALSLSDVLQPGAVSHGIDKGIIFSAACGAAGW